MKSGVGCSVWNEYIFCFEDVSDHGTKNNLKFNLIVLGIENMSQFNKGIIKQIGKAFFFISNPASNDHPVLYIG